MDRSDWNSVYNYDFDDGASFIGNSTAHLSQYACHGQCNRVATFSAFVSLSRYR